MNTDYNFLIKEQVEHLLRIMKQRVTPEELELIRKAYKLAAAAHSKQKRKSGEPYIIHPIAVAIIVAEEFELGANPVIAALLHDVVEDTDYTIDDIAKLFGMDVAFLVKAVTKQKKTKYEHTKQVDNYYQILASVKYDIRALLVKLADRLHNMRTLQSMPADKQMKIAGETDYFYAPFAHRLGLYHIKSELETLSFRYRCPREYATIHAQMEEEKSRKHKGLESLTQEIGNLLVQEGITARLEVRYRLPYSVWRKMQDAGCDFSHIEGKHYIRIIYDSGTENEKRMCMRIYSILSEHFKERPGSVINYINAPKENGYQSFHVKILSAQGTWEEIHISSERMLRDARLGCVSERTESNVMNWLRKFKEILRELAENKAGVNYMEYIRRNFYQDDIMVFTPQGRGIILPKHATALDFAFELDRDLGTHAIYARINGRLSAVITPLHRGDCVFIGTDEKSIPDPSWIDHVCSYKAKDGLSKALAQLPRIQYHRGAHCHPLPGDEVIGFKEKDGSVTIHKRNCPEAIRLASQHGDSIVETDFEEDERVLYPVRIHIRGVDRYHLLSDLLTCITDKLNLSMHDLHTTTTHRIAECTIDFAVHSLRELQSAMDMIKAIDGIDEVSRVDIE